MLVTGKSECPSLFDYLTPNQEDKNSESYQKVHKSVSLLYGYIKFTYNADLRNQNFLSEENSVTALAF